jgi:hypothetical protein
MRMVMILRPLTEHCQLSLSVKPIKDFRFLLVMASASQLLAVPLLVRRKEHLQGLKYRNCYSSRPLLMRMAMIQFFNH